MFGNSVFSFLILFSVSACAGSEGSDIKEIFSNDAETRTLAKDDQRKWLVSVGRDFSLGAGVLLRADMSLSANHIAKEQHQGVSGKGALYFLANTIEQSKVSGDNPTSTYDYSISKLRWQSPKGGWKEFVANVKELCRAPTHIVVDRTQLKFGKDGKATAVFALGYPGDKESVAPHVARGFLKEFVSDLKDGKGFRGHIKFNFGAAPGNSGGPVYLEESPTTLVSIVTGGPSVSSRSENFANRDLEDSTAWNWGPALFLLYRESEKLQEIFPGGRNKYVDDKGQFLMDAKEECFVDNKQVSYLCEKDLMSNR